VSGRHARRQAPTADAGIRWIEQYGVDVQDVLPGWAAHTFQHAGFDGARGAPFVLFALDDELADVRRAPRGGAHGLLPAARRADLDIRLAAPD
jgi:hypothetical protein